MRKTVCVITGGLPWTGTTHGSIWFLPTGTDCLVICGPGGAGLLVGLNDLKGL